MKRLLSVFFLLPLALAAQELVRNELDAASHQKLLETGLVSLKSAADTKMDVSLRAAGPVYFLQLKGWGVGANTINTNDMAIFLLDNDSTVILQSATIQGVEEDNAQKTYKHEYTLRQQDLESLSRHKVQAVRKYSVLGFDDIEVDAARRENLKTLCSFFLQQLDNAHLLKAKPSAPAFPGGKDVWLSFLNRNLKLPAEMKSREQRTAQVAFLVRADGTVTDIRVKQSAGVPYDNELLRVLNRMPRWKPALADGKAVDFMMSQQVRFYQENAKLKVQF